MLCRIKNLNVLPDYLLEVNFDDGKRVIYDVKEDIEQIPSYIDLRRIEGLFNQARLDESRTCIIWNENIDLPSDTIYEYGQDTDVPYTVVEESAEYIAGDGRNA